MSEWGNPAARSSVPESIGAGSERGELKHLSTRRKRTRRDSASSGERTRNSLNRAGVIACRRCRCGVAGPSVLSAERTRSYKSLPKPNALERAATEGDRPVRESVDSPGGIPSKNEHGKLGLNPSGPPDKAKYS